jgi:hypothetical protein
MSSTHKKIWLSLGRNKIEKGNYFREDMPLFSLSTPQRIMGGRKDIDPFMEFLDHEDTCNTSPVSKRDFSIILQTHTHYCIHKKFRKLLLSSSGVENSSNFRNVACI